MFPNFRVKRGRAHRESKNMSEKINVDGLYRVSALARLVGIHPVTIYKSLAGLTTFSLPKCVRLGRTVRFRGADILDWQAGLSSAKIDRAERVADAQTKAAGGLTRRGRPAKAQAIARRLAAGGAS